MDNGTRVAGSAVTLPDYITELVENAFDGNSDFNSRAFRVALWFVGHEMSEDAYVDFVSTSGIGVGYTRNDLTKRLRKTYQDAEDKYDPALASGSAATGFAEQMQNLYNQLDECYHKRNRRYVLALVQRSINTGHNPVSASIRDIIELVDGIEADKSGLTLTQRALSALSSNLGYGLLHSVTYDGEYGHARLWRLCPHYRVCGCSKHPRGKVPPKCYICTCKDISNTSTASAVGDPETRFVRYVEPLLPGTEVTVTLIASELNITRPAARKLLDKYLDRYFGGGYFEGDRRTRTPAKWWRSRADGHHHDYRGTR
jgi:hypothetical protein